VAKKRSRSRKASSPGDCRTRSTVCKYSTYR
jgi:hypothetical protein